MKKGILTSIYFAGTLFVILLMTDRFLDFTVKKCNTGHLGKVNKILDKSIKPQIAIFGPSLGENGFNSLQIQRQTNKTVYNFCLAGTIFMQYEGLINELNEKSNETEIFVLSEFVFNFQPRKQLTEIENYLPYLKNKNIYNSLASIDSELTYKSRYIPFYKFIAATNHYYTSSFRGLKHFIKGSKKNVDTLMGYLPVKKGWNKLEDDFIANTLHIDIIIDSNIVNEYIKCVNALKQKGRKVVITIPPIYIPKGQKVVDLEPYRNTLKSIAQKTNSVFWDFSESMVDKKYFHNIDHLNTYGALVFSNVFADSLNNLKQ